MKNLNKKIIPVVLVGVIALGGVLQSSQAISFADELNSPTRFKD